MLSKLLLFKEQVYCFLKCWINKCGLSANGIAAWNVVINSVTCNALIFRYCCICFALICTHKSMFSFLENSLRINSDSGVFNFWLLLLYKENEVRNIISGLQCSGYLQFFLFILQQWHKEKTILYLDNWN